MSNFRKQGPDEYGLPTERALDLFLQDRVDQLMKLIAPGSEQSEILRLVVFVSTLEKLQRGEAHIENAELLFYHPGLDEYVHWSRITEILSVIEKFERDTVATKPNDIDHVILN